MRKGTANSNYKGAEVLEVKNGVAYIRVGRAGVALVDEDDLPLVQYHSWRRHNNHSSRGIVGNIYAIARADGHAILMHRVVLGLVFKDGKQVDHINRDGLDNRRSNLRIVSQTLNNLNCIRPLPSTGFVGARLNASAKRKPRYYSTLRVNGKSLNLGSFDTPQEASAAYRAARIKHYGEQFAVPV